MKLGKYENMLNKRAWEATRKYGIEFEDAKQEAYVKFYEAIASFDKNKASFSTHLYNQLKTLCNKYRRNEYKNKVNIPFYSDKEDIGIIDLTEVRDRFEDTILFFSSASELDNDCLEILNFIVYRYDESKHGRFKKNYIRKIAKNIYKWTQERTTKVIRQLQNWWRQNCHSFRRMNIYA